MSISALAIYACDGGSPATQPTAPTASPEATREPAPTAVASPAALATETPAPPVILPLGFPLDPDQQTDAVVGEVGAREIVGGAGATVRETSIDWQPGNDPAAANQFGWNCRVHVEYEGEPAVDWYVPNGTPVYATMDGEATLYINTFANSFDHYGVGREPYIGNPDRARAPVVPFPGPGGGMGVWVSIENEAYVTEYGHLELASTLERVPPTMFLGDFDYAAEFAAPRAQPVVIARWTVRRGDIIGYTGDAGYSEAPHLHYQIIRLADGAQLCPTSEAGFVDGGWLER